MTLIANRENVGFGRAVNQALARARAPLVLDHEPGLPAAARSGGRARVGELAQHPQCAIAGPRILNPDGSVQGSARGDPDMLTGLFGRSAALRRLLPVAAGVAPQRRGRDRRRGGSPSVVVDWLSGACVLARRDALAAVGGFDERYFLYWEDADLCRRLRARGAHVRYVPSATAVHRVGHSSRTARAASLRAFHESAYLYYATHVAPGAFNPKRPLARALLAVRCWWLLRAGRRCPRPAADPPAKERA